MVPCCKRNPYCLNLSLQYYSNYVVYDPTAFIACKLVIVAWLIAYGAAMKPRAPVEQLPHGDAARHMLVSRSLTKHHCQVTPPYRSCNKIFPLGKYPCVLTGNPQRVDGVVLFQRNWVNVVLKGVLNVLISVHLKTNACYIWGKEDKGEQ